MQQIGEVLMLVFGGVWTGMIVAVAVERVSLWGRMSIEQYAVDFRRSLFRFDPLQPILLALTALGTVLFALESSGQARSLAWVALGLLGLVLIGSTTLAEPMNSQFRRRVEGDVPPDAASLRRRWRFFHLARTVVACAALVALALAATQA